MSQTKDKIIAIVGGGPGGLTLARLLQMNGANVTVYERDASRSARVQGATLDLHEESGLKALRKAGINIVAIHQHMTGEEPRVLFLHYWGTGTTQALARGLRSALDRTATRLGTR